MTKTGQFNPHKQYKLLIFNKYKINGIIFNSTLSTICTACGLNNLFNYIVGIKLFFCVDKPFAITA